MRGQGRVYRPKDSTIYWLDYSLYGKRFRESSHTDKHKVAGQLLRERLHGRETGKLTGSPDKVTFEELRALVERQYGLDGRRSLERVQIAFTHLATMFSGWRAVDITAASADAYAERRLAGDADNGIKPAARATVNRELAALRRGFRLAVKKGLLATRPEFEIPAEDNVRTGFFEDEDFQAVLAELPAYVRPIATFMFCTGWRTREVLALTWANVDWAGGIIRLEVGSTKNGEGRVFPFRALPALVTLLTEQRAARKGLYLLHRNGQRIRDFYEGWHNACKRAAVKHVNGREVVVRPQLVGRIPHDFRRTAVRNFERAGVSRSVAMQLTGHKTESVYRRYAIVAEQDLRDGVEKLARGNGMVVAKSGPSGVPAESVSSSAA